MTGDELGGGGTRFETVPGRHVLLRVVAREHDLLVKQGPLPGDGARIEREGEMLELLARSPCARAVPPLVDRDPGHRAITVEWMAGGPLCLEDPDHVSALAVLLAAVHALDVPVAPPPRPRILSLHRPGPGVLREASRAQLDVIRKLQGSDAWRRAVDDARRTRRPIAIVHGDPRPGNALVRNGECRLVDWELAGRGDPAADVGGWLGECLVADDRTAEAFARAYARAPRARRDGGFAGRVATYAAVRLVGIAWERAAFARDVPDDAGDLLTRGVGLAREPGPVAALLEGP